MVKGEKITSPRDSFYHRMHELSEGDMRMFMPFERTAKAAYAYDQRFASVAMGTLDGLRIVELGKGDANPSDDELLRIASFVTVAAKVAEVFDIEEARGFLRRSHPMIDTGSPLLHIAGLSYGEQSEDTLLLKDVTLDFIGN